MNQVLVLLRTPPSDDHPNGLFYNQNMSFNAACVTTVPDQFEPCVYKTGCLGSPNKELRGRYFIHHDFESTGGHRNGNPRNTVLTKRKFRIC